MIPTLDFGHFPAKVQVADTEAFLREHPEFHPCEFNSGLVEAWFTNEAQRAGVNQVPFTKWNLEVCLNDLTERGLLSKAPNPRPSTSTKYKLPDIRDAGIAVAQPSAEEKQALAKLQDDPSLSDHARKQRDEKLRLLAGKQRRELSELPSRPTGAYPYGGDPPIRI